jgi:hypothetical protein
MTQTKTLISDGPVLPKSDTCLYPNVDGRIVRNGKTEELETLFESNFAFRACYHFQRYSVPIAWAGAALAIVALASGFKFYPDQTIDGMIGSLAGGGTNFGISKILGMKKNKTLITLGFCAGAFVGVAHADKMIRDKELQENKSVYMKTMPKDELNSKSAFVSTFLYH